MTPLALASLVTAACCFVSMFFVAILAGIRLADRLGRAEETIRRLRRSQAKLSEDIQPLEWINDGERQRRMWYRIRDGIREETKGDE